MPPYGYGSNETTRNWTAGFSPCFHLPGFYSGYLFLTHCHTCTHGIHGDFGPWGAGWFHRTAVEPRSRTRVYIWVHTIKPMNIRERAMAGKRQKGVIGHNSKVGCSQALNRILNTSGGEDWLHAPESTQIRKPRESYAPFHKSSF